MNNIYISGPMTGHPNLNYPLFERVAKELREAGFEVISPAENQAVGLAWTEYMKNSIRLLLHCDGIYMLQGWQDSKGATLEHEIAKDLGYQIIYQP
jgi:hypothetical protein